MAIPEGFIDISAVIRSGIYLLLYKGEVVYVGQSVRLSSRIAGHVNLKGKVRKPSMLGRRALPAIRFDGVQIMGCVLSDLDRIEKQMIERYQPKYNINHNPKPSISLDMLIDLMPHYPMIPPNYEPRQRASWRRL